MRQMCNCKNITGVKRLEREILCMDTGIAKIFVSAHYEKYALSLINFIHSHIFFHFRLPVHSGFSYNHSKTRR